MIYSATILDVQQKTVSRKRDGKTITMFEIEDSEGRNPATSRRDLANEAHKLKGQVAELQVRVEQNGTYQNVYLEDVRPATASAQRQDAFPEPVQQTQPVVQAQNAATHAQEAQPRIPARGEGTPEDWAIWRQTATKVAAHLAQTPDEFWFNVRLLMTWYSTGIEPSFETKTTQPQPVTSYAPADEAQTAQQSNQFVPDNFQDPGPQDGGYVHDDSDIPFTPTF